MIDMNLEESKSNDDINIVFVKDSNNQIDNNSQQD